MKAPFFEGSRPILRTLPQTTIRCHSVRVLYSPDSLSFQLTLVARENRVWAVPLGVKLSLCVFAEKPDERDAILAEHFVVSFSCPFCWGDPVREVLLPRARNALLGETFRGNRQSRVPPSRQGAGL